MSSNKTKNRSKGASAQARMAQAKSAQSRPSKAEEPKVEEVNPDETLDMEDAGSEMLPVEIEEAEELMTEKAAKPKTDSKADKSGKAADAQQPAGKGKKGKEKPRRNFFRFMKRKTKEVSSELKKVTWPRFPKVVKQTSVVLSFVIIFLGVLLGLDKLFEFIFKSLV